VGTRTSGSEARAGEPDLPEWRHCAPARPLPAHPCRRVAEAASDLFGIKISTGTVDAIYAEAGRRLASFVTALVAVLRSLPMIHADETTDRIATLNCWMHVVSTARYTLIHASATRGWEAVKQAGVLLGYRGVVIYDRLALYWKLETAKHGICGAHSAERAVMRNAIGEGGEPPWIWWRLRAHKGD